MCVGVEFPDEFSHTNTKLFRLSASRDFSIEFTRACTKVKCAHSQNKVLTNSVDKRGRPLHEVVLMLAKLA